MTPNSPHLGRITLQEHAGAISLVHLRYAPDVRLATHAHEKACFVWIQTGAYAEAFGTRVFQLGARQVLFRPAGEKHSDRFSSIETSCVIIEVSKTWLNLVHECGQLRTDPFVSISPQMGRLAADLYVQAQQKDTAAPLAIEGLSYALGAELMRESMRKEGAYPPPLAKTTSRATLRKPLRQFHIARPCSLGWHTPGPPFAPVQALLR